MKNYSQDPEAMAMPWCESPFAHEILSDRLKTFTVPGMSEAKLEEIALSFIEDGFAIIDLDISPERLQEGIDLLKERIMEGRVEVQAGHFHYNEGERVFNAWQWNPVVHEICVNEKIMSILKFLYNAQPYPFQTINFVLGSNQPVHSDAAHFHTVPERYVCGYWVPLERVDSQNGPLVVYPGSHKLPIVEFQDLNMEKTAYQEEKENYTEYEEFLKELIRVKNLQPEYIHMEPGQALIWAANLLHGGSPILDRNRTRWSQATHVYFDGCSHYYTPFYSDPKEGDYSEKNLKNKNIMGHKLNES